jgi:hypothetical protein
VTVEEQARVREALLALLSRATDPQMALELAEAAGRLDPAAEDSARVREALLALLNRTADRWMAKKLPEAVARLAATAEERAQTRKALLALLAHSTHHLMDWELAEAVAALNPTVADLGGSDSWPSSPNPELLAAARQNSELSSWLLALPLLFKSAHTAAESDGALALPQ